MILRILNVYVQIAYSRFEYWKRFNNHEELRQSEEKHEYPPRFCITCFRKVPNEMLSFNFNVAKKKEAILKIIAEFPVFKETAGMCYMYVRRYIAIYVPIAIHIHSYIYTSKLNNS